jgi:hypothetical protein
VRYQALGEKWAQTLEKAGIQIFNKGLSNTQQLAASLRVLIQAAEEGEWDRITDLSGQILMELELAGKPDFLSKQPSVDRKEVEKIIQLLNSAIEQCSTRMGQIGPLLSALKVTQKTSASP